MIDAVCSSRCPSRSPAVARRRPRPPGAAAPPPALGPRQLRGARGARPCGARAGRRRCRGAGASSNAANGASPPAPASVTARPVPVRRRAASSAPRSGADRPGQSLVGYGPASATSQRTAALSPGPGRRIERRGHERQVAEVEMGVPERRSGLVHVEAQEAAGPRPGAPRRGRSPRRPRGRPPPRGATRPPPGGHRAAASAAVGGGGASTVPRGPTTTADAVTCTGSASWLQGSLRRAQLGDEATPSPALPLVGRGVLAHQTRQAGVGRAPRTPRAIPTTRSRRARRRVRLGPAGGPSLAATWTATSDFVAASFNVHAGVDGWGRPLRLAGASCRALDADVLVLQESWQPERGYPGWPRRSATALGYAVIERSCWPAGAWR